MSELIGERMGGFASWGQWTSLSQGSAGQDVDNQPFWNPNLFNMWLDNVVEEGNTAYKNEHAFLAGLQYAPLFLSCWSLVLPCSKSMRCRAQVERRGQLPLQQLRLRDHRRRDRLRRLVREQIVQLRLHIAGEPVQYLERKHSQVEPRGRRDVPAGPDGGHGGGGHAG